MSIFQELSIAIAEAMNDYVKEKTDNKEDISKIREQDIINLTLIMEASKEEGSAYRLRSRLIEYIDNMSTHWLSHINALFDSRLRQLLRAVLEKSEYQKNELLARENIELRQCQKEIGTAKNGDDLLEKLDILSKEIQKKTQQIQLTMHLNDQLTASRQKLALELQAAISDNQLLQTELKKTQEELSVQLSHLQKQIQEQKLLIDELNKINQQLRLDKEKERSKATKIQTKLDKITPKYTQSLKTIEELRKLLTMNGIEETPKKIFSKSFPS
jgi:hypothetical protein